jgi:hypothetical protein
MKRKIDVVLGTESTSLGELRYDRQGRRESAAFAYTSDWLATAGRFEINPFPDRYPELKTWISENTGPESSLDALRSEAAYFRISPAQSDAVIGEVATAVAAWRQTGERLGMTATELDGFAHAFDTGN